MAPLSPPRGTNDILGHEFSRFHHVIDVARKMVDCYGFEEWITPIFESTKVFSRSLGITTDIVSKEMYTFEDRRGESLTLRPENTAAICRALISNGLTQSLPQKVFYAGPMFRYERPQAGRYRQFHQIGAELMGVSESIADAELIAMGYHILKELGIAGDVTLQLNTMGDHGSRARWREAVVLYFREVQSQLSEDSRVRLERNPLRILDSKAPQDRALMSDVPKIHPFLTPEAQEFWDNLRRSLEIFKIPFVENPLIVRGMDYYNHTAFEYITSRLGAQGTVLAGGRYDGLVQELGGPNIPSVGWAAGVERLAMLLRSEPISPPLIVVVPVDVALQTCAVDIMQMLRGANFRAEMAYRGNVRRQMTRANARHAAYVLFLGREEYEKGTVKLKNLHTGDEVELPKGDLVRSLKQELQD